MTGLRLTAGLVLLLVAAGPAAAQENPIDFFTRLIEPPAKAIGETFRPTKKPDLAESAQPTITDLVPLPRERPDRETKVAAAPSDALPVPAGAHPAKEALVVDEAATQPLIDEAGAAPTADEAEASPTDYEVANTATTDMAASSTRDAPTASQSAVSDVPMSTTGNAMATATAADRAVPDLVATDSLTAPLLSYAPVNEPTPFDALVPTPRERPDPPKKVAAFPPLIKPPPAAMSTCGAGLTMVGVTAEAMTPVADGGGCGIAAPVAVTSLEDGDVELTETAVIECRLAERLAGWLADDVQPAATAYLGGRVTGLRIAASYDCRNRNNLAATKLSEHAKGNAIDISAFRVNGEWIEVGRASSAGQRFLSTIRQAACGPFTTVLGPGSDSYHSDHFHLDQAKRRTAGPSKGLYCR
jgi:hypothetical protein